MDDRQKPTIRAKLYQYCFGIIGKELSARKSLAAYRQVKQKDAAVNGLLDEEFKTMQDCIERAMKEKARFIDVFLTASRRRAFLIIFVLAIFERCTGISPTMAYSTEIMPKVCLATVCSGLAAMTSGAWLAWPASAIKPYKEGTQGFTVKTSEISTLVALMDLGNVLSPIPSSYAMDAIGRRLTLFITAVLYIASGVCALVAYNVYWLYFARLFAGLGKGIAFAVIPIYFGEVASIQIRGALSTMFIGFLNIGMFYDYAIGSFVDLLILDFANLVIPLVFTVGCFFFPESPYYLLMKGKKELAKKSLAAYRQDNSQSENELKTMQTTVENDMKNKARFIDIFSTASSRRALLIISALALFQRSSGISPTLAYSTEIMPKEGGGATSNVYMILFSFLLILANYATMPLIDRWGRKPLLIVSSITTGLTTLTASVYYYLDRKTNIDVTNIRWIPYACLIIFAITYSIGIGFIPSTLVGELFPTNVKSYASSISAIILAATSFSVNKIFYDVAVYYGPHYMYWFFTIACFACVIFIYVFVFETKGKSFTEIQEILKNPLVKRRDNK